MANIFVKESIDNFKGLTSCKVTFSVDNKKIIKKLRFYFSYIKEIDCLYIISIDFISMEKITGWSKIEEKGHFDVVDSITKNISPQLDFYVNYYKNNFNEKKALSNINRNISKSLILFYQYIKIKSKINSSIKKLNNKNIKLQNNSYEEQYNNIIYI